MSDSDPERTPSPGHGHDLGPIILVAGLGVSFVTAGTALVALGSLYPIFGIPLILLGMGVIVAAVWPFARQVVLSRIAFHHRLSQLSRPQSRGARVAGIGTVILLLTLIGIVFVLRQEPATITQECDRWTGECHLEATTRSPGSPLIFRLEDPPSEKTPNGVLTVDTRLEGATEGRYVAIACRSNDEGEYVLAVWPDDVSFELIEWDGDDRKSLRSGRLPGVIHSGNEINQLALSCIGPEISATINGTLVTEQPNVYPSDKHGTGRWYIAAGISRDEEMPPGPVSAQFANLTLDPVVFIPSATPTP
ncbi:MAG TPA: hypothetical protein VEW66_08215 [Thermomicrobiales bacterium]|nr:hypothetical protein [Thermomicrobiales bacterium]